MCSTTVLENLNMEIESIMANNALIKAREGEILAFFPQEFNRKVKCVNA